MRERRPDFTATLRSTSRPPLIATAWPTSRSSPAPPRSRKLLGVVEIVSPQDPYPTIIERLQDYHVWGVPYIWLVDPEHHTIHRYDGASLLAVGAIELREPAFRLAGTDLFAELA